MFFPSCDVGGSDFRVDVNNVFIFFDPLIINFLELNSELRQVSSQRPAELLFCDGKFLLEYEFGLKWFFYFLIFDFDLSVKIFVAFSRNLFIISRFNNSSQNKFAFSPIKLYALRLFLIHSK